jgi:3-oxoacyl-[acyl-carrier protein] reductase
MKAELSGRTALVTGASSGLGLAAALALVSEGAEVVINSRSAEKLEAAAEQIRTRTGSPCRTVPADIATEEGIQRLADVSKGAPVDILVANGGGPPPGQFLDHGAERWREADDLVLQSAIRLSRIVLPSMKERGWGRLIYITSVGVLQPIDDLILSNTYRAGVTALCKTISNTYAQFGVTANCVCPGFTATERLTNLIASRAEQTGQSSDEVSRGFTDQIPARRFGQPEELAALIAFLASDRAAYISGVSIPVDGGFHRSLL